MAHLVDKVLQIVSSLGSVDLTPACPPDLGTKVLDLLPLPLSMMRRSGAKWLANDWPEKVYSRKPHERLYFPCRATISIPAWVYAFPRDSLPQAFDPVLLAINNSLYRPRNREIMYLVASIHPSVCPSTLSRLNHLTY